MSKINLSGTRFLTSKAKITFSRLKKAFIEALILHHFDLEYHIWMKTDSSGFYLGKILSQLTLGHMTYTNSNLSSLKIGQWNPIAFFSRRTISDETWYKIYNESFLAIIEIFKTWRQYWEGCKYGVLIFINHNNLCQFMHTKRLNTRYIQ